MRVRSAQKRWVEDEVAVAIDEVVRCIGLEPEPEPGIGVGIETVAERRLSQRQWYPKYYAGVKRVRRLNLEHAQPDICPSPSWAVAVLAAADGGSVS